MTTTCGACAHHHASEYGPEYVRCRWTHGDTVLYAVPSAACVWTPPRFQPLEAPDAARAEGG